MTDLFARVLYAAVAALMRLPWRWLLRAADALAELWRRLEVRESRVARTNLRLAYPDLLPGQRDELHRAILRTTARQAVETLRLWTRPHAANLRLIREQYGVGRFEAALAAARGAGGQSAGGRGVIVAAPHYGNWELLNQWLAARTELAILYRPPESRIGEAFLRRARADAGDRVTQVRAEARAMRQLFRRLGEGGVVGILPDQQPKAGDGEFAPFFGVPALGMTLLGRLAARTGATVLFAYCERIGQGEDGPAFALHVEPAPEAIADPDPQVAVAALNAAVERIARRDPAQYQWTYKRYTLRPPGSGEQNPYREG